jgi:HEPN domain-containing protein
MKDETRQWLEYAQENLCSAEVLLKNGLYNPCLQNAQQTVEKMLKALLVEKNIKIKKTHSVGELARLLKDTGAEVHISEDECELFDSIYLPSKYPVGGILPDYEPDETICRQCLGIANRILMKIADIIRG